LAHISGKTGEIFMKMLS